MDIILTEGQYEQIKRNIDIENTKKHLTEKWDSFNEEQRNFIVEMVNIMNPKQVGMLNEAWWNTIGDIVGIIDPTGLVDLFNGLDYMRQGDYFFGMLSMISIIPYVGDAVAKPLIFGGKASKGFKAANTAMKSVKKTGDVAEASKVLSNAAKTSPMLSKLINASISWGGKLKSMIDKIPGGKITSGFRKTLNDWIDMFISAARNQKMARKSISKYAQRVAKSDPKLAKDLIGQMKKELKGKDKFFKNFKANDPTWMAKNVWPGFSVKLIRNRDLTSLMRRTKFYAGLLDFLGVANFVGPDELVKEMGNEQFDSAMGEYAKTREGQQYWSEDMSGVGGQEMNDTPPQSPQEKSKVQGMATDFLKDLLF
jgi:hypothetical protein